MTSKDENPVFRQFIQLLQTGYEALDESSRQQVANFVNSQQHDNGGFMDRAGQADLYYSLFGYWLSAAIGLDQTVNKLKTFTHNSGSLSNDNTINYLSLELIRIGLQDKENSIYSSMKKVVRGSGIDFSYRIFLFMLLVDARVKFKSFYFFLARLALFFFKASDDLPCSVVAALTFAKKQVGMTFKNLQKNLLGYAVDKAGFKAFKHLLYSDTLSTAVALFALYKTGQDLRLLTPGCLQFVEQNFSDGAFLSGDGDESRDLEYTFYGLLALGTLVRSYES